jgi:glycosyltransferase involved in cell wall biosynthesis
LLESLTTCTPPDTWEIIVVDNGSADNTRDIVSGYMKRLPIRYLFEGTRGKSRALNLGMRYATGEILLFTDDDIIPDSDWLASHIRVMNHHPEINIVGGRVVVDKSKVPGWVVESFNLMGMLVAEHDLGDKECIYGVGKYPYGPNMAVRRIVAARLDYPWPEYLGPGTVVPVGDEIVFTTRISRSINDRLYSPACVVEHRPRVSNGFFLKSVKRCFLGGYAAGRYAENRGAVQDGGSFIKLAGSRISTCKSIRELCCIVARAAGFYTGHVLQAVGGPGT